MGRNACLPLLDCKPIAIERPLPKLGPKKAPETGALSRFTLLLLNLQRLSFIISLSLDVAGRNDGLSSRQQVAQPGGSVRFRDNRVPELSTVSQVHG